MTPNFQIFDPETINAFDQRQIADNYNQDPLHRFRGTLTRVRRQALLSKDPRQLMAFFQLSSMLGIDPSFSNTGRVSDRRARAENKFRQDTNIASLYEPAPASAWLTL